MESQQQNQAQLGSVLLECQNPDQSKRMLAEQWLVEAEKTNFPLYVQMLTQELITSPNNTVKQLAGLVFKNTLTAKDDHTRAGKFSRWLAIDPALRAQIKTGVISVLASPSHDARSSAAQVASHIAQIELPRQQWPDLIKNLLDNVSNGNDFFKQASLETLGYVCEDIEPSVLANQSNDILTAVCRGIKDANPEVKLAGCNALYNALEFARANFEIELERNFLMTVICTAASDPDVKIRVVAFECIVKVGALYYDKLPMYMNSIFQITMDGIKKDDEKVALQGIEFWSTLCDEEMDIALEAEEATPTRQSHNFIKGAIQSQILIPTLTECLTKQDEEPEEDAWNVAMSAGTCLSLIATTVGDDVVPYVVPFVQHNINNANWKLREAATLAFGAILEGPTKEIPTLITQALPLLLAHMKDPNTLVKDTTAWTLGRIVSLHPQTVTGTVPQLFSVLVESLGDTPRVASNVCWSLHNLADMFRDDYSEPTSTLTPFFNHTLMELMKTTEREDSDENNLRASAYETIGEFIQAGARDTNPTVLQATPHFIERLKKSFSIQVLNTEDRDAQAELQSLLCGVLQNITQKLGAEIKPHADIMMSLFLEVFKFKSASVHEEALMAVGALANAVETDFERYMPAFKPFLIQGLRTFEEHQVCSVAVGVVGDVSRALGVKLSPYCDEIMTILLQDLQNPVLNRSVKPPILSSFGDIAMAIGKDFVKYLGAVMSMLQGASQTQMDTSVEEFADYLNQLRESVLEAYTGIVQGLRGDNVADPHLLPYVNHMISFIGIVAQDPTRNESVTRAALGLVGDLAHALGARVRPQLSQPFVKQLIQEGLKGDEDMRSVAQWVKETVSKN